MPGSGGSGAPDSHSRAGSVVGAQLGVTSDSSAPHMHGPWTAGHDALSHRDTHPLVLESLHAPMGVEAGVGARAGVDLPASVSPMLLAHD